MKAAAVISLNQQRAARPRDLELCVVVACDPLVCALPARWVERLVLPHEVATVATPSPTPPLLLVGERQFVGWNLGTLLGLRPLGAAWILLRLPHRDRELMIALATGACLAVQSLPPAVPLPPGAFTDRRGAISGAFATTAVHGRKSGAPVGLWLDPARLFTDAELAATAGVLDAGSHGS